MVIEQDENQCVTHLVSSIYLGGGPSGVLHIVLLHLGTNFWTGSDVTCRLRRGKKKKKKKIKGVEEVKERTGKGCSYIKTW